ncbi:hypothetical protein [Streptomyces sp. NPDC017868]|uniref:hypothetical protein n=1 Tax=unclassified Streptomyces TaxID=2593676 RepID=UPI003787B707
MSGRDTVLGDIRSALVDVPDVEVPDGDPAPRDPRSRQAGPDVVGLLVQRATGYRATVVRVPPSDAVAAVGRAGPHPSKVDSAAPGFPDDLLPEGP